MRSRPWPTRAADLQAVGTDGQAAAAKTAGSAPLPSKLGGDAVAVADKITAK